MREIKFRGRRIDNGEWVYGDIVQWLNDTKDVSICCHPFGCCIDHEGNLVMIEAPFVCKVDPATVGQFTGLHDKNGVEIYEGDILKEIGLLGVIECHAPSFKLRRNRPSKTFNDEDLFEIPDLDGEIIGNIYENSDLLEGGGSDG